eukprot:m.125504 g.125504  ORF g.125504 m.125504 type:complete len:368 (-) comp13545_c0_seq3:84-1187(-)
MAGATVTVLHTTPNEGVDPEVGKVQLDAPLDIEQLMAKTMGLFEIGRPAVRWKDEEGDLVTVATTADLEEAVRHFPEGLMLWVFQPDHPAAAAILHTGPQVAEIPPEPPKPFEEEEIEKPVHTLSIRRRQKVESPNGWALHTVYGLVVRGLDTFRMDSTQVPKSTERFEFKDGGLYNVAHNRWVNVHSEFACLRQQFTPIETDWTAESAETCCTIKIKGNYLVAEEDGTINCDRPSVKHAEKFLVVPHDAVTYFTSPHGKLLDVAKRKHRRSQYVDEAVGGARGRWWCLDGGLFDISRRKWMTRSYTQRAILTDTFDEVEIVPLENGSVAFRHSGKYLSADDEGNYTFDKDDVGPSETFQQDGAFSL